MTSRIVGEWAMVVEARDPVDPTGRNARSC
jgi:hypothetical protein